MLDHCKTNNIKFKTSHMLCRSSEGILISHLAEIGLEPALVGSPADGLGPHLQNILRFIIRLS